MDVSSRRCSMTLIVPGWEHSAAAYDAASFDAGTNGLISPAAGGVWCSDQSYATAAMTAQQQLVLSSPGQTPAAPFAGCQMYQQQQQQQHFTAQRAATSPLPLLVPVCTASAGNQPLQLLQQQQLIQQQQQVVMMSSPMPSAEYMFFEDCVPSYGGQPMNALTTVSDSTAAAAAPCAPRTSFCLGQQQQLPALAAGARQRPASFTDTRYNNQQQQLPQQQLVMMANGQQLAAAAACSSSLSCPLPMLLPQQQQQQQQMLLCQDMGFSGQLPTAVCGAPLDSSSFQGAMLPEIPVSVPATLQQQQQQLMMVGLHGARVPSSSLPGMMLADMQGSNQQQQQQQMCMPLGTAMVSCDGQLPSMGSPLAQVG
jgi:hypothetical protein